MSLASLNIARSVRSALWLLALGVTACGGAQTGSAGASNERPFHPSCREACERDCPSTGTREECSARCDVDCAPASARTGAALATQLVEALRSLPEDESTPLDPVLAHDVAWRVFLSGVGVAALANVSPQEQPTIARGVEDELARSEMDELRRLYVRGWREEIGQAPCTTAPGALEGVSPFAIPESILPSVRERLAPELARAAQIREVVEVRCGDRAFRVVILPDAPAIVPLL